MYPGVRVQVDRWRSAVLSGPLAEKNYQSSRREAYSTYTERVQHLLHTGSTDTRAYMQNARPTAFMQAKLKHAKVHFDEGVYLAGIEELTRTVQRVQCKQILHSATKLSISRSFYGTGTAHPAPNTSLRAHQTLQTVRPSQRLGRSYFFLARAPPTDTKAGFADERTSPSEHAKRDSWNERVPR